MQLTGVDRLLWAFSLLGHCSLLAVLLVRRRASSFPAFTSLIALNILRTIVLFLISGHFSSNTYFYTYWTLAFVDMALQLAIAYELATHVFRPLGVWAPDLRRSFSITLAISVFVAAALAWLAAPLTRTVRQAVVTRGDLFATVLMGELFVAMLVLSVTIGLPWRTHVASLAQGFGTYAIVGLIAVAAHTQFASGSTNGTFKLLSHAQMFLYLSCLAYWIVTLALPEPAPRRMPAHLHQELVALQRRTALTLHLLRTTGTPS